MTQAPMEPAPVAANLLALAARVEQAAGADREIDNHICLALGWKTIMQSNGKNEASSVERGWFPMPRFTASLDAAMTLANELGGQVTFFKDGTAKAFLWQPYPLAVEAKAATPALALTAACLRARDRDGSGEAGETRNAARPVGQQPGPRSGIAQPSSPSHPEVSP